MPNATLLKFKNSKYCKLPEIYNSSIRTGSLFPNVESLPKLCLLTKDSIACQHLLRPYMGHTCVLGPIAI